MQHSANQPHQPKAPKRGGRMRGLIAAAIVTVGIAGGASTAMANQPKPPRVPVVVSTTPKPATTPVCSSICAAAWKPR